MYNTVKFWAINTPSNASISLDVLLSDIVSTPDEAILNASTVLTSWGVSPSNFRAGEVRFDDIWAD